MIAPVLKLRSCQHTRHNPHLVYRSAQMRIQPGFQVCIFRVVEQQESEHKHHHDNGPSYRAGSVQPWNKGRIIGQKKHFRYLLSGGSESGLYWKVKRVI